MLWHNYTIEDLRNIETIASPERSEHGIAVIDDEIFPLLQPLQDLGFIITKFDDIRSISEIRGFDIIICDIKGVGKSFSSKFEGAHVIKEISRKFPQKYLIVYSGSTFDVGFNEYFALADKYVKKGTDIADWVKALDNAISKLLDPTEQWERTRRLLKEYQVSPVIISKIEKGYIKSLVKRDVTIFEKVIKRNSSIMTNEYVAFSLNALSGFTTSILSTMVMS